MHHAKMLIAAIIFVMAAVFLKRGYFSQAADAMCQYNGKNDSRCVHHWFSMLSMVTCFIGEWFDFLQPLRCTSFYTLEYSNSDDWMDTHNERTMRHKTGTDAPNLFTSKPVFQVFKHQTPSSRWPSDGSSGASWSLSVWSTGLELGPFWSISATSLLIISLSVVCHGAWSLS